MIYEYQCDACGQQDDRYIRLVDYERERGRQKCACGATMRRLVGVPKLVGLDSGPDGFMRGRVENDGIADDFARRRLKRAAARAGTSIEGKMFVPGLCRPGKQFDPFALCSSRDEVIKKARQLGVGVKGPGMDVAPRVSEAELAAREEEQYLPSEKALKATIVEEITKNHGGQVTRKKYREIVTELQHRHGQKKRPTAKPRASIFPENM